MRRIAWLHCIERKARKESLLVSWVVPASTHNHSSFIVQHVWQLHEGFFRQIFNHFSLGFHFIHCNKTLKTRNVLKSSRQHLICFQRHLHGLCHDIYLMILHSDWSKFYMNFPLMPEPTPETHRKANQSRAGSRGPKVRLYWTPFHSRPVTSPYTIATLHDNCARVCDNITSSSLFSDYQLTSYNKQPRCLTGKPSSRTRTCPRRCSRTRWTAPPRPSRSITSRRTSPPTSRRSSTRSTTRPGTASWAETSDRTSHTRLGKLIIGQLESTLSRTAHNASKVGIKHKWILVEQNRIEPSWTFL